jgi:NAD(P)-dependent dehydrogenase (short-subunit alcohol dehydrogenase family)
MSSKIALVTGASSGIGEASAKLLAQAGFKVYGTSRRGAETGFRTGHRTGAARIRDAGAGRDQ